MHTKYHMGMASKTTVNFDDEMEAAPIDQAHLDWADKVLDRQGIGQ